MAQGLSEQGLEGAAFIDQQQTITVVLVNKHLFKDVETSVDGYPVTLAKRSMVTMMFKQQ